MTAENFDLIVFAALGLAAIFFIISVVLFIRFNIPKVLGDLTGTSTKRGIRQKQEEKIEKKQKKAKVKNEKKPKSKIVKDSSETMILEQPQQFQNETMLLNEPVASAAQYAATEVLSDESRIQVSGEFTIEDDVMLTDGTNIIE